MKGTGKKTLGVYGPKYPDRSGVADYIERSLRYLKNVFECTHVSNHDWQDPSQFDLVLYHLGNNKMHHCAFEALRSRRGPILLHEYNNLDYYYSCWELITKSEKELILCNLGRIVSRSFNSLKDVFCYFDDFPALDRYSVDAGSEGIAIDAASTIIVHSEAIKDILLNRYPDKSFNVITQPVSEFCSVNIRSIREQYGLGENFVFGTFGFIGQYKRIEKILESWCQWEQKPADVCLLVVGEPQYDITFADDVSIKVTGYVSDDHFNSLILACDCGVQLRHPSLGETSGVMCKLIAHNRPLITSAIAEVQDLVRYSGVTLVPTDSNEVDFLRKAFIKIYESERQPRIYHRDFSWEKNINQLVEILSES